MDQENKTNTVAEMSINLEMNQKEGVDTLSKVLLESFYAPLQTISAELELLEQSQLGWLTRIDVENSKFLQTDQELKDAILLLQQVPAYTAKLNTMKKEMAALTTQTKSLAAVTRKLKEKKAKEAQERIEKDRMLLAQPASSMVPSAAPVSVPQAQKVETKPTTEQQKIASNLTTPL